jgi:hypothetical protein
VEFYFCNCFDLLDDHKVGGLYKLNPDDP